MRFWFKLGCISFGGPAGQIAIMHRVLVEQGRWISEAQQLFVAIYGFDVPFPAIVLGAAVVGGDAAATPPHARFNRARLARVPAVGAVCGVHPWEAATDRAAGGYRRRGGWGDRQSHYLFHSCSRNIYGS